MPRDRLIPLEQGHLDGLCGVYSVINAIRFALQTATVRRPNSARTRHCLTDQDLDLLFMTLIEGVIRPNSFARSVVEGLDTRQLWTLLRLAQKWMDAHQARSLAISRPLHRRPRIGPKRLLASIAIYLSAPGTAVIVGTEPPWRHWTVATRVTRSRLHLLDSGGNESVPLRLSRKAKSYHAGLIKPANVYLLIVE
jgi:hypothetical protein